MEQLILGLSGRRQSGKNTAANQIAALQLNALGYRANVDEKGRLVLLRDDGQPGILDLDSRRPEVRQWLSQELWPWMKTYSFADTLKEFCVNVFGLQENQVWGTNDEKNTLTSLLWVDMPGYTGEKTGNMTGREVLQYFGTNVCRHIKSDCWVYATINKIQREKPALAVVTDVRFPGEVYGLKYVGGKVIRLSRAPFKDQDTHESESALDNFTDFDAVLENPDSSIPEQAEKLIDILTEWKWFEMVSNETVY